MDIPILPALSREGECPIDYKAIMKKKVCDEIEQFFTKAELTTMSNYEKLRLRNMRKNYEMMAELGLPVIKPEFMRGPKGKKRVKKVVEESDSDEEWIPASKRKSSRTVKPVATFRYPIKEEQKKRKVKQVKKEPSVKRTAKPTATETVSCPYPLRQRPDTNYMMMEGPDDDHFLYCEECNKEYEGDCPVHGPLLVVMDTQVSSPSKKGERAEKTLPPGLEIRPSSIPNAGLGVFAIADFPTRTRFGPYEGDNIKDADVAHNSGYCWQVCVDGRGSHFVDAANVETANWMRFVNCARTEDEQNVTAYQFEGSIYYRSYKPILPGNELLVWYGQDYARDLGIRREVKVHHSKIPDIYPCDSCYISFHSVGYLWKHMKNKHEGRVTDQICAMAKLYGYSVRDFTFKLGSGFIFVPHSAMGEQNLKNRQECVKLEPTVDSKILQNDCYNTEVRRKHFRSAQVISCHKCGRAFSHSVSLERHTCVIRARPFKCSECGKGFTQAGNLQQHMRCHTGEKPFKCSECGKGFTVACSLKNHMRCHTGEKPFKCSECGKGFTESGHLQRHMRCHTGEKPFKCSECGKGFTQAGDLQRHMRCHTGEKPFKCSECGKGFTESGSLKNHMRCHTGEKPFKCSECGKGFTVAGSLKKHMRCHTGEKPFKCSECVKGFTQAGDLQKHMRCHTGEKPFKCSECGKGFTQAGDLQKHMRCHTGEKPFKCSECGKGFTQAGDLQRHMRCHTGEKPFKCSECGKGFTESGSLKNHMRCHTGEKPFKCSECGKGFTVAGSLKKHMRCHTGEKPFKCSECVKGFTQAGDLQRHMRCHTGEKPFKCSECGKGFTQAGNLQKHMRCHTGEKPFKCSECGKGFTRGESLKNHMQCHS